MPALANNPACCDRMDNEGFDGDEKTKPPTTRPASGMELEEVKIPSATQTINTNVSREQCCKADLCQKMHKEYLDRRQQEENNPTDRIKTLFFVGTLGLFIVWLILYTTMSKFDFF